MSSAARPATQLWRAALAHIDGLLERTGDERAAALASLAGTQPELHSLVDSLLCAQAEAETSGFLEPQNAAQPAELRDGALLGPYRLESRLGIGGMGEVWLARRSDGLFDGEVAIKTLHPWFARGALRERFLREAQLLGRVSHPNISRLLDAGVADDGSLYLVLEYVRGIPLDQYCDDQALNVERRLEVFRTVCSAVVHAHSHLIVHRDLKPSNILVTGTSEVKLLDFGVATLLEADTASASDLTRLTGRAFTPEFAAPEQLRGEAVTTATDVYSLGVILYQLLTGQRPYAAHSGAALEHAVLQAEAPLPSRAVRASADDNAARQRGTSPRKLWRALTGDLDNIVARALEKNPVERYPGVQALADDIARHLDHQPIQARAASARYRALKFLRRNRVAVAVGGAALAAVLVVASVALWQAGVARTEAHKANAIRDFLVGVFERNSVSHPDGAEAREVTAEQLLAQSVTEIRTGLADSPEVRRELLGVMSRLYSTLDMQANAIELLNDKLAVEREIHGEDSLEAARTLGNLGYSYTQAGEYEKAEASSRRALEIFDARGDSTSLEVAVSHANVGQVAYRLGRGHEAVRSNYATGLALVEEHHPRSKWRVEMLIGLARAAGLDQKHQLVVDYCDQAVQLIDSGAVESDGVVRGGVLEHKAHALGWVHRYEESDRLMHEAIAEFDRAGGPGHSFAAEGRRQLGSNYMWSGRRAQASELLAESLSVMERVKGPDDRELTAHVRTSYATNLFLRGELAAAEPHMLHAWRNLQGPETALLPHTQINLLRLRTQQGRFSEAREYGAGVDERTERIFGKGSWMHTTALVRLGELSLAEGRNGDASAIFSRVLEIVDEAPDAMTNNPAAARLGLLRVSLAEPPSAATVDRARILLHDIENSKGRHDMPDEAAAAHMLFGLALLRTNDAAAARAHFDNAVKLREGMDAPQSLWLAEARLYQARGLHAGGETAAARRLLAQAEEAHRLQPQVGPQYAVLLADTRSLLAP